MTVASRRPLIAGNWKLHHGIAALTRETAHACHQQVTQTLGQIRAAEELDRIGIFDCRLALHDIGDIGDEIPKDVAPLHHVGMRLDNHAPRA